MFDRIKHGGATIVLRNLNLQEWNVPMPFTCRKRIKE